MERIQILSTKELLQDCLENDISISDFYEFVENKPPFEHEKLIRLKNDFLQFRFKALGEKLPEIMESEKYKIKETNGEYIPLMGPLSKIKEKPDKHDPQLHSIVNSELPAFIDTFLPSFFIHFDSFRDILDHIIETEAKDEKIDIKSSPLKWDGSPAEFAEWLKAAIENGSISGGKDELIFRHSENS